nr:GATA transcription factor 19-like [Ipomoea batatas]
MDMMHNSWAHHTQMPYNNYSSSAYGNEYGYMEDDDRDSAFLSWRLNVHCSSKLMRVKMKMKNDYFFNFPL